MFLVKASVGLVKLYQRIAPRRLRDACLYEPTCSTYAILALRKHGFLKGWSLAARRIMSCRPPNGGKHTP
ncbi:membrane protein insertion efficiency factor YidD [Halomonas litopenaei]|uniref:membrane protein insertion efficiency factor YidD n=1 Tax=Halomonas litopenaei TaxID=2109328 RepID=UPI001A8FBAEB|nr:membrane protein insertion efficiency factor YidD [Halomonas litopenaei]